MGKAEEFVLKMISSIFFVPSVSLEKNFHIYK